MKELNQIQNARYLRAICTYHCKSSIHAFSETFLLNFAGPKP